MGVFQASLTLSFDHAMIHCLLSNVVPILFACSGSLHLGLEERILGEDMNLVLFPSGACFHHSGC